MESGTRGQIYLVLMLVVYLTPWFIALGRGHHNTKAIFATTILLGWTFIGWAIALIWSLTSLQNRHGASR